MLASFTDNEKGTQAAQLVPQIQALMEEVQLTWDMLDAIACTTGPGGFTSVRIGIATARGLAFAAGIPAYGIPLMEVMAWYAFTQTSPTPEMVTCVLPAGSRALSVQSYAAPCSAVDAMTLVPRESFTITGHSVCGLVDMEAVDIIYPLEDTAQLMAGILHSNKQVDYPAPVPLYAKPPDAAIGKPLLQSGA